MFGSKPS